MSEQPSLSATPINQSGDAAEQADVSDDPPSMNPQATAAQQNGRPLADAAGDAPLFQRFRAALGLSSSSSGREDLEDVLAKDELSGQKFSPAERDMLRNIMRLRELRVDDVMVPRADIDAVDQSTGLGEALRLFEQSGHSRMPVYRESLDDPIGFLHIKDVMALITTHGHVAPPEEGRRRKKMPADLDLRQVDLARPIGELDIVRQLIFVPPSMAAQDLMTRMQATRIQMALVIDEYGGTDGLVSIMDVLETVFGELDDEHDEPEGDLIVDAGDGAFIADSRAEMEDVVARVGPAFVIAEKADDEDFDTIGGYVFAVLGRVPTRGEVIRGFGPFEIEVLDADPRRIRRVKIYPKRASAERAKRRRPSPTANS